MSDNAAPHSKIISSPGGTLPASKHVRRFAALADDGTFYVAAEFISDPQLISYEYEAKNAGYTLRKVSVDLATIESIYHDALSRDGGSEASTETLRAAIDLIAEAARAGASDIHIRVQRNRTQIRMRIHGDLQFIREWTREKGDQVTSTLYQSMTDVADGTFQRLHRQDASISRRDFLPPELNSIRIATTPTVDGHLMVLRLLPEEKDGGRRLEDLGHLPDQATALRETFDLQEGMLIIAGPTGSGKSTTLKIGLTGMLVETGGRKNVLTIEDPIEYPIPGAVQTPVTNARELEERKAAFGLAIRGSMRLDPDVIMISEIRDPASAELSLSAAMTGHLVVTTLHANSAIEIIDRLTTLGLNPRLLGSRGALACLAFQRLARVPCPYCRISYEQAAAKGRLPNPERRVRRTIESLRSRPGAKLTFRGDGCEKCSGTGIAGRSVVAEVIVPDAKFLRLVREGHYYEAEAHWIASGGKSFTSVAAAKACRGEIEAIGAAEMIGTTEADREAAPTPADTPIPRGAPPQAMQPPPPSPPSPSPQTPLKRWPTLTRPFGQRVLPNRPGQAP